MSIIVMENKKVFILPKVVCPILKPITPLKVPPKVIRPILKPVTPSPPHEDETSETTTTVETDMSINQTKIPIKITLKPLEDLSELLLDKSYWLPGERWRKTHVRGYYISSEGRCFSDFDKRIKNVQPDDKGYIPYCLRQNNKSQTIYAHQLVMAAFVGPYPKDHVIDHIDRVKHNNKLDNLRYATYSGNGFNKTKSEQRGNPINQFDLKGNLIKRWDKAGDAADHYKISAVVLRQYVRRQSSYIGFMWDYAIDEIQGELWKTINVPTGTLKVSNHGRVENGFLKPHFGTKSGNGYREVMVGNKPYKIHHLVCTAFKGDPPCVGAIANHLDENRANNHIDNLEWVSGIRENNEYSLGKGVNQYNKNGDLIATFRTIRRASETTGIPDNLIARSCRGIPIYKYDSVFKFQDENHYERKKSKRGKKVIQLDLSGKEVQSYNSIQEACDKMGMASSSIHYHCSRNGIGNGFRWKFG